MTPRNSTRHRVRSAQIRQSRRSHLAFEILEQRHLLAGAELSLLIYADAISEFEGSALARVSRNSASSDSLWIELTSSDSTEASVPTGVMIPAGQASTTFAIDGVDDTFIDGTWSIDITATAIGHEPAVASLLVRDNDTAEQDFFVSPQGSDNNSGTISSPFLTIERGMEVIQPGYTLYLREGVYRETVQSMRSGVEGRPITVQSYEGESVTVTATDVVGGAWTETVPGSGIFYATTNSRLESEFWTTPNPTTGGSQVIERDGKLQLTVANESAFQSVSTRSLASSDVWNFFTTDVTWKVRGLSISNTGTSSIAPSLMNSYFTVMPTASSGWGSNDSVNVRLRGDGTIALLLNKNATNNWGASVGSFSDSAITGFDLTLGPGNPGEVNYQLTAFPSGHVVANGAWSMAQADWSDGGDGSNSYVQIFAQEGDTSGTNADARFKLSVDEYEIQAGGSIVFSDEFSNGDVAVVTGPNPIAIPEVVETAAGPIYVTSGYDQIFVDGEMQHEARQANRTSTALLDTNAAALTVNNVYQVTGTQFAGFGADYFAGARFHARVGQGWSWQTAIVESSSSSVIQLDSTSASNWWWPNTQGSTSNGGVGYFYGKLEFLDADGEWHLEYNPNGSDRLYLRVQNGENPTGHLVEQKARHWTVAINHDHIVIKGLDLRGGAVKIAGNNNVFEENDARYLSHYLTFSHGGRVDGGKTQGGGVVLSGADNIVRGNTIYDTAGSGIVATGNDHLITRNHIHDIDYSGTYATGISLSGGGHTATFNTIHDAGRDILRPTGAGLTVMYNELYRAGRLAFDLGAVYTWGIDGLDLETGRKSRIAYNWIHQDGNPSHPNVGIYLDNYSQNYVLDHNVLWDIGAGNWNSIRLNAPLLGVELYHNTLVGVPSYNITTYTPFPDSAPSAFWTSDNHMLDYVAQNNLVLAVGSNPDVYLEDAGNFDFRPKKGSSAVDPYLAPDLINWVTFNGSTNVPAGFSLAMKKRNQRFEYKEVNGQGIPVEGINHQVVGETPDSGAYERGLPLWSAGVGGISQVARVERVDINSGSRNRSGAGLLRVVFSDVRSEIAMLRLRNVSTSEFIDVSQLFPSGLGSTELQWDLSALDLTEGRYVLEILSGSDRSPIQTKAVEFLVREGDLSGDAAVNFLDFGIVGANFDPLPGLAYREGDANGDGAVNFLDFGIVGSHFNPIPLAALTYDWGDARSSYPTTEDQNGARHILSSMLYLGHSVDSDPDGDPSTGADTDAGDDGISVGALLAGRTSVVNVVATASDAAYLNAWIDFNQDGDWNDEGEYVVQDHSVVDGNQQMTIGVPADAVIGQVYARFRITSSKGYAFDGLAADGEVEDYVLTVAAPGAGAFMKSPRTNIGLPPQRWGTPLYPLNARLTGDDNPRLLTSPSMEPLPQQSQRPSRMDSPLKSNLLRPQPAQLPSSRTPSEVGLIDIAIAELTMAPADDISLLLPQSTLKK